MLPLEPREAGTTLTLYHIIDEETEARRALVTYSRSYSLEVLETGVRKERDSSSPQGMPPKL